MKRNINSLTGFVIGATDGEIGSVKDFFLDDETWTIRYIIVKTGGWLLGRKMLISTKAIVKDEFKNKTFDVNLTMEQVKTSPDIEPISRYQGRRRRCLTNIIYGRIIGEADITAAKWVLVMLYR
jgi:hypothetical protein